jgi:hypothetical protein
MARISLSWWLWLGIGLVAIVLRFWQIDRLPPGFHLDESFEGVEAWRVLTDPTHRPLVFSGSASSVMPLNIYANALVFGLVRAWGGEPSPTVMRMTAACFGLLGVWAIYALARELQRLDRQPGGLSSAFPFLAAALLATLRWHLHFSRMGIETILAPLLWTSTLWLLLRGWRTGAWLSFAGCGVLMAASVYAYPSAWVIPPLTGLMAVLLLIQRWWGERPSGKLDFGALLTQLTTRHGLGFAVAGVVALWLVAPLGWFFWSNPDMLFVRLSHVAATKESESTTAFAPLLENGWKAAMMFGPFGEGGDPRPRRNLPGAPVLSLWWAIPFYLGALIALWRIRRPGYLLILSGLGMLAAPCLLTNEVPHFHRMLGMTAPIALLCAIGLDWLWQTTSIHPPQSATQMTNDATRYRLHGTYLYPGKRLRQQGGRWLAGALLVLGAVVSARDYFVRWATLPELYYDFNVPSWEIGQQLAAYPTDVPTYLTPRHSAFNTVFFPLLIQGRTEPTRFDGNYILPFRAGQSTQPEIYAVVEADDPRTGGWLAEFFPSIQLRQTFTSPWGSVYARLYERPAGTSAQRAPQYPRFIPFGDGITLVGYELRPTQAIPGQSLVVQAHWQTSAEPSNNWHILLTLTRQAANGQVEVVANHDNRPGESSLYTSNWQAGWRLVDEYELMLPAELSPGEYELALLLHRRSGEQLPADRARLPLGIIHIEPTP